MFVSALISYSTLHSPLLYKECRVEYKRFKRHLRTNERTTAMLLKLIITSLKRWVINLFLKEEEEKTKNPGLDSWTDAYCPAAAGNGNASVAKRLNGTTDGKSLRAAKNECGPGLRASNSGYMVPLSGFAALHPTASAFFYLVRSSQVRRSNDEAVHITAYVGSNFGLEILSAHPWAERAQNLGKSLKLGNN